MPRKSPASLSIVTPKRPRSLLVPSADAPAEVVEVFREILTATRADHFVPGDAPLVRAYAEAIVVSRKAAVALEARPNDRGVAEIEPRQHGFHHHAESAGLFTHPV